jgi:Uma2 family endonuclease
MTTAIAAPEAPVLATKTYTPDEYLALEVESDTRNEYRNGEVAPMTGGTPAHNQIAVVLNALLWFALRGKAYSIFSADQRLWIPDRTMYTYPDSMVIPRPVELQPGRKDTVTNPVFIAEVLSSSTQGYDRGDKFAAYRTIATFQEYLLIDQSQHRVEQYTKQSENQWLFTEHRGKEARLLLSSISVELALMDLYENIEFLEKQE